jgi:succinyl-diaminopimelate desuccinylase
MSLINDTLSLTQKLLRINTVNPPGHEKQCMQFIGSLLAEAGFLVKSYEFADGRPSLVARSEENGDAKPICFAGHIDTVPVGDIPWKMDPFAGETKEDLLFGRGSSDMKGGVAAMLVAGMEVAKESGRNAGITLVITAGEETGSQGAQHLARLGNVLGKAGAIVVPEPTSNRLVIAHKGALWLKATTRGVVAHGSMPEKGDNAIYKAVETIGKLRRVTFDGISHPILGHPTLNVGTIAGGTKINMIPGEAKMEIDIRMVPGQTGDSIIDGLKSIVGPEVAFQTILNLDAVTSNLSDEWIQSVAELLKKSLDPSDESLGVPYFTDASFLTPAYGNPPTVILGPGEPSIAHKIDEYCHISKIQVAKDIYASIARIWCGL